MQCRPALPERTLGDDPADRSPIGAGFAGRSGRIPRIGPELRERTAGHSYFTTLDPSLYPTFGTGTRPEWPEAGDGDAHVARA